MIIIMVYATIKFEVENARKIVERVNAAIGGVRVWREVSNRAGWPNLQIVLYRTIIEEFHMGVITTGKKDRCATIIEK